MDSKLQQTEQELAAVHAKFSGVNGVARALEQKLASNRSMLSDVDHRLQQNASKSEPYPFQKPALSLEPSTF